MSLNIKIKKASSRKWLWFIGLYIASISAYGLIEILLHYLNNGLQYFF